MGRIEMNYQKAIQQAKKLEDIAENLKRLATSNMEDTLNSIAANWVSTNADRFCAKGHSIQHDVVTNANNILITARNIRKVAKSIYDAEKAAEEIARKRTYMNE